jgi:glycosyltransferase involved in cell wall biosynthesis
LKTSKTIVHLIPGLYLGGAERVLELVFKHQVETGNKVYVITFEVSGFENFFPDLDIINCVVQYEDSLFGSKGIRIQAYEDAINRLRPQFIHSHAYWTDLISHYHLRSEIKYITHFHLCYDFFTPIPLKNFVEKKNIHRWIDQKRLLGKYKKNNCFFLASSEFIASFYRFRFPQRLKSKIKIINNPVDLSFNKSSALKTYNLLTVGRLEEVKNHKLLLNLIHYVRSKSVTLNLAIVGEGSLRRNLEALTNELAIEDNVFFLGPVKKLDDLFSVSDIYIHVSHAETFGLAIFEAMAAGLPVIVKAFEGIDRRILIDGENCIIVEDEDLANFLRAITLIRSNPKMRENLVKRARETVKVFSPTIYLERMDEFYARINGE